MFNSHKKEIHEELINLRMEIEDLREQLSERPAERPKPGLNIADEVQRLIDLVSAVGAGQAFKLIMETRAQTDEDKFSQQLLALANTCHPSELEGIANRYAADMLPLLNKIATMDSIPLTVLQELNIKLGKVVETQWNLDKGEQAVFMAGVIKAAPDADATLATFESGVTDPELKQLVRDMLFDFEAFRTSFGDRAIRELLKEITNEDLTFALVGSDEEIREVFLRNLSERARMMIEEDIEIAAEVPARDVENAKLALVRAMRMLLTQGRV